MSGVSTIVIPDPDTLLKHDVPKFHNALAPADNSEESDPNVDSQPPASHSALAIGDEVDAEVTVKIHLGGNATTTPEEKIQWVHEGLRVLAERKGLQGVDTLLIGFRGVDYKGKKTAASEFFGCGAEGMEGGSGSDVVEDQLLQQVKSIWEGVSKDLSAGGGDERQTEVKTIGTLYLPLGALKELSETQYPPKINSLDTPDCHHLPQEYAGFAKEGGIELWAGGGGEGSGESHPTYHFANYTVHLLCSADVRKDPLPAADLHNLLNEFVEARPELLSGASDSTSGLLRKQIPLREDGLKYSEDVQRGVEINWILGVSAKVLDDFLSRELMSLCSIPWSARRGMY